ncbi:leucine-rich repeat-containing protein 56 isoform X2 [Trichomycterus rosablanca]|uniref:leucine-rich repeat-containing protein 56 isoform X2 n=1 Tax=Trichomycterus rosablanca TaxID=2290929 RepID=UPI002F35B9ED
MNSMKRPGTALSFVTEFEGSGQINPSPATSKNDDLLFEPYISPQNLRDLSGSDDLQQVTSLEMCVDTRLNTLGNFGVYLPNLVQLKMNNSLILSVRDLGTTLSHLQVLSLVRCGLTDLDGIPSFSSLKELYVAYNKVSDLSQISMLEQLKVLDLEGNDVDDLVQVQYLGLCGQLRSLTLDGNPVRTCLHSGASQVPEYNYRSAVRKLIPQLQFLDDAPAEEEEHHCSSTRMEDWALLKESITDIAPITDTVDDCVELLGDSKKQRCTSACDLARPGSAQRPSTSICFGSFSSRPSTARPSSSGASSRPSSSGSDADTLDHQTSDLTHGVGKVLFCGNPLQVIRARRQKNNTGVSQGPSSHSRPCTQLGSYVPEHTYNIEVSSSQDRTDIFAELIAWRKEHSKRLLAIERERQPQVMRIMHSDDDNDDDDAKNSGNDCDEGACSLSLISDREEEEERDGETALCRRDTESPDSLLHCPSPDVSRLSLSDHTMSPSPPPKADVPSTGRRIAEIRARRLRVSSSVVGLQGPVEEILVSDPTASRMNIQPAPPQTFHKPHRPDSSPVIRSPREPSLGNSLAIGQHQPIICSSISERLNPTRPRTARAALQRLAVLPDRGSSQLK